MYETKEIVEKVILVAVSTGKEEDAIESLDELKNAKGTFCIEVNDNVNEYKFEIE